MKFLIIPKISLFLLSVSYLTIVNAQVFIEQGVGPQHQAPTVTINGPDAFGKKIPLSRIKGTPFLQEEWQLASLYDNKDHLINTVPVRLNLATDQFHFMWKGEELVADEDNPVALIIFHPTTDSVSGSSTFIKDQPGLVIGKRPVTGFVQVINNGNYQLLKYRNRRVFPAEDSLFGTQKRYIFRDVNYYFLKKENKIERLKKLNAAFFLALLPGSSKFKEWIDQNNLEFNNEEEMIFFLNYYNSQNSQLGK